MVMSVDSKSELQIALQKIREESSNPTEQGRAFERLIKVYLENDDIQKDQYSKVWHYEDWAKEHSNYQAKDTGIDLVTELSNGEGYCAIQCKFYQSGTSITKKSIDSFISAASTPDFVRLILVDTTDQPLGKNVTATLDNLEKPHTHLPLNKLEESRIRWMKSLRGKKVHLKAKNKLRPYQEEAVKKVIDGLAENDRGKMIMACGLGKTLTSLRIAEEIAGDWQDGPLYGAIPFT